MAKTSEKTVVRNGDEVTEDSGDRQLTLCELTTMEVLHSQLTPTVLRDGQIQAKGYIWGIKHVLRGAGGLEETQMDCENHRLGSNPTRT